MQFYRNHIHGLEGVGTSLQDMPHRIATDCQDRAGISCMLAGLIHPFDVIRIEQHRELVNIYSGEYSKPDCNLHEAISIALVPPNIKSLRQPYLEAFMTQYPEMLNQWRPQGD